MPAANHFGRLFKVIVLGDANVGKSSLLYKYETGTKPPPTMTTTTISYVQKVVKVDDDSIKLSIWDPAGQERLREAVVPLLYRNAHAVVFVYDVTKPSSLFNLNLWLEECEKHHVNLKDVPVMLLANKCDLKPVIQDDDGKKFAKDHGMTFFKTSISDTNDVAKLEDLFLDLARKLKDSKKHVMPDPHDDEIVQLNKKENTIKKDSSCCC